MPVYNARRYVAEAIESILGQTFDDFEFVIVDDGSTDGSLAILREYEGRDKRIKVISRPNTGIVGALNDGLAVCRADLVARMDADDISHSERLEKQVRFMSDHPECVALSAAYTIMDPNGLSLWDVPVKSDHVDIERELMEASGAGLIHSAVIYRRCEVLAAGAYRTAFECVEDTDLWFRLIERGRVANLTQSLLRVRYHFASIGKSQRELQQSRGTALIKGVYSRRGLPVPDRLVTICDDHGPRSPVEHYRRWSGNAVSCGYFRAARKYALKVAISQPLRGSSFWLMADAYLGPQITQKLKSAYRFVRRPA
jgi:glycosyltransferase involved in cell wall biosynthesis